MTTTLPIVRRDLLPENATYDDDGCDVAPACLECPLPVCKYDNDVVIFDERVKGRSINSLTEMFSVSRRTIQRILMKQRRAIQTPHLRCENHEGQLLTLRELSEKSIINKKQAWPEIKR